MKRVLPRALAGASAAIGVAAYFDDEWRRSAAIGLVGSTCRLFMRGGNRLTTHDAHHLDRSLARPAGTALLTVSNHIAVLDDPHLLASIVPLRTLLHGSSEMRWGVCGDDVCFRPGTLLCRFADAAKVLPIKRGAGIWQSRTHELQQQPQHGHAGVTRLTPSLLTVWCSGVVAECCRCINPFQHHTQPHHLHQSQMSTFKSADTCNIPTDTSRHRSNHLLEPNVLTYTHALT